MSLIVRRAKRSDEPAIQVLLRQLDDAHVAFEPALMRSFDGDARRSEWLRQRIEDPDAATFVAEIDTGLVGYGHVRVGRPPSAPVFLPEPFLVVEDLVVADDVRRTGIGRALMDAIGAWGHGRGIDALRLNVFARNEAARAFYEGLGFRPLMITFAR